MKRASQVLLNPKLGSKLKTTLEAEQAVAFGAWRAAVGKRIAELTYAAGFEKGTLRIYVEDKVWQAQLAALMPQILKRIHDVTGIPLVRDVTVRVMPGRRGPAVETQPVRDEVDGIEDPMLRRVYQRKKA